MNTQDDPREQRPGETAVQWRSRLDKVRADKAQYEPGGYMSTRNEDGSSRGGAARMFERYGWF